MFIVEIIHDDEALGIKSGELYNATRYPYDEGKIILVSRIPDGYDPSCTQYFHNVKIIPPHQINHGEDNHENKN